jgi:hypothetical protein
MPAKPIGIEQRAQPGLLSRWAGPANPTQAITDLIAIRQTHDFLGQERLALLQDNDFVGNEIVDERRSQGAGIAEVADSGSAPDEN